METPLFVQLGGLDTGRAQNCELCIPVSKINSYISSFLQYNQTVWPIPPRICLPQFPVQAWGQWGSDHDPVFIPIVQNKIQEEVERQGVEGPGASVKL